MACTGGVGCICKGGPAGWHARCCGSLGRRARESRAAQDCGTIRQTAPGPRPAAPLPPAAPSARPHPRRCGARGSSVPGACRAARGGAGLSRKIRNESRCLPGRAELGVPSSMHPCSIHATQATHLCGLAHQSALPGCTQAARPSCPRPWTSKQRATAEQQPASHPPGQRLLSLPHIQPDHGAARGVGVALHLRQLLPQRRHRRIHLHHLGSCSRGRGRVPAGEAGRLRQATTGQARQLLRAAGRTTTCMIGCPDHGCLSHIDGKHKQKRFVPTYVHPPPHACNIKRGLGGHV